MKWLHTTFRSRMMMTPWKPLQILETTEMAVVAEEKAELQLTEKILRTTRPETESREKRIKGKSGTRENSSLRFRILR